MFQLIVNYVRLIRLIIINFNKLLQLAGGETYQINYKKKYRRGIISTKLPKV